MKTSATRTKQGRKRFRAALLAAAGACLWLSAGGIGEAQPPPAPVVDFTVNETKKEGDKKGEWEVTTEVKNNTGAKETIVWWSWPAEKGGPKIGDLKWYPPGTVSEDPDSSKPGHKRPKKSEGGTNPGEEVAAGGTAKGTTTRTKDPHSIYVRVFKKKADGTWEEKTVIAHNVHLAAVKVARTDPPAEYVSIPVRIPYPTDLADFSGHQPADFFIKSVTLPEGWQTAFLAPGIEERFQLLPHQREFTGILVVKMTTPMAEGEQAVVGLTWGAESGQVTSYEKSIRNLLVSDNTPPVVTLRTLRTPEGILVTVGVHDPGGIQHSAHLSVSRAGVHGAATEVLVVPRARVLQEDPRSEIGATAVEFETTVRSPVNGDLLSLQASAMDQFGNAASSPEQVVAGAIDADQR